MKVIYNCCDYGQVGKKWSKTENVGPTFSSLTMLLGQKSLKTIDLLDIDFNVSFFVLLRLFC